MTAVEVAALRSRRWAVPPQCVTYPEYAEPLLVIGGEIYINISAPCASPTICTRFLRLSQETNVSQTARRPRRDNHERP